MNMLDQLDRFREKDMTFSGISGVKKPREDSSDGRLSIELLALAAWLRRPRRRHHKTIVPASDAARANLVQRASDRLWEYQVETNRRDSGGQAKG